MAKIIRPCTIYKLLNYMAKIIRYLVVRKYYEENLQTQLPLESVI